MDLREDSGLRDELAKLRRENEKLEMEKLLQGDEIRALKVEVRSYQDELKTLSSKVQSLEAQALQETPARTIGKAVRLRYLEKYRQRMGRSIGKLGWERIRCGDKAAHRGRALVDALICLTGLITDREVYTDLYGMEAEYIKKYQDVSELMEVAGFRASLQSEGRLSKEFRALFERLLQLAKTYHSPMELGAAFRTNQTLQQLHGELQSSYDKIVEANPR